MTIVELPKILQTEEDFNYLPTTEAAQRLASEFDKSWNVILWNDDVHTYAYIISCLMKVLGISVEAAFEHAYTIDHEGKDCIATTTQEKAEYIAKQLTELELTITIQKNA